MSGISKLYINQKLAIHRFENGNDDPQKRDLSDVSSPYIWVDATYVKCRDGGHVSSCALVAAIGAASDGCRGTVNNLAQIPAGDRQPSA